MPRPRIDLQVGPFLDRQGVVVAEWDLAPRLLAGVVVVIRATARQRPRPQPRRQTNLRSPDEFDYRGSPGAWRRLCDTSFDRGARDHWTAATVNVEDDPHAPQLLDLTSL